MYGTLALPHRALDDLRDAAGEAAIAELRALARPIEGLRVLNLSVTGFGTGTAELLNSSVPLMNDLGLDAHWQVVRASEEAAQVGRAMYQALGGVPVQWTREMTDIWLRCAEMNAGLLTEPFDVIIVHDPQPLAIRSYVTTNADAKWLMHSHLDLSSAQEDVWMLLRGHIARYNAAIFEAPAFARDDMPLPAHIVPPAIDPNSARNMPLSDDVIRTVLTQYGIDPERPLLCHVSPCDAASDLCGVVDVWQKARGRHPELQLVFVLTTEPQDPHGRTCYDDLARRCREEPSAFIVSAGNEVGNVELNVFQRAASVVLQKGLRKGFGLWVSDALWKERPCVVAPAGGLTEQVIDGQTGIIANTTDEFAAAVSRLLEDPATAAEYGKSGRQHVAERFLITRYLRDYLRILDELHRKN
ncbi:MAG: glycosyltransferase [Chloroflexota bacterium]